MLCFILIQYMILCNFLLISLWSRVRNVSFPIFRNVLDSFVKFPIKIPLWSEHIHCLTRILLNLLRLAFQSILISKECVFCYLLGGLRYWYPYWGSFCCSISYWEKDEVSDYKYEFVLFFLHFLLRILKLLLGTSSWLISSLWNPLYSC